MATIDTIADRSTGSAIAGKAYFETSTNKFIVYNGSAWIEIDSDGTGAVPFQNRWAMDCSASGIKELKVAGTSDIILQDSFTIATWFKTPSSITGWSGLINWGYNSPRKGRGLGFNGSSQLHFNGYASHWNLSGATTLSGSTWYHGVAVVSAINSSGDATATVYLNGQQDSATTEALEPFLVSDYVHHEIGVGPYPGATNSFDGLVDEVAIFNTELSAPDVAAMYNGTAPNGVPVDLTKSASYDTDRTSNLKGYWRMGDDSGDSPVDAGNITGIVNTANPGTNDATTIASSQPTFSDLTGESIYV